MKYFVLISALAALLFGGTPGNTTLYACAAQTDSATYEHISQEEAAAIMSTQPDIIILDVRTQEEYESGHIPGAICIPLQSIDESVIELLPNKEQVILVHCRSGKRSVEASGKLAELGYTNIKEFGGILTWEGETVTGALPYGDKEVKTHLEMTIDGQAVGVAWEDNPSVDALKELVADKPLDIPMSMHGGFEQYGPLGATLPSQDEQITTSACDIVLYESNQIVVFYGSNTWSYTKLGTITNKTPQEMTTLLGNGDIHMTLTLVEEAPLPTKQDLAGTYIFEEGFAGDFTITLQEDGTYTFYEGPLSSYLGSGTWDIVEDKLVLVENEELGYKMTNKFTPTKDALAFIEKGSSNFIYIKVKDGQKFTKSTQQDS